MNDEIYYHASQISGLSILRPHISKRIAKKPHVHYNVYHKGTVTSPTSRDKIIIDKVNSWLKNRKK